jgi:HAD superfamily hydrolase (TIGR01549 family)
VSEYDAVLFDNDGVLVEPPSRAAQAAAVRAAFASVGVEAPDPDHVERAGPGATVEGVREVCAEHGVDADAFWTAREDHDERSQVDAFDAGHRGAYDDVDALDRIGHACGVVSNNHHATVEHVLERFDLGRHFETYYGRERSMESLRRKKPGTHYLERALADLDAERALYVGDSASDVVAARRAGMDSAFVRREHSRDTDLPEPATHEVRDLHGVADLL